MDFISLIRFVATLLITNSHIKDLYPTDYSFLGTGGMIGSSLFFFCSGYTLYLSLDLPKVNGFKWLFKRLLRIYPSLLLFRIFSWVVLGEPFHWINIIVPGYLFLNTLVIFYFIFYIIVTFCSNCIPKVLLLMTIPYVVTFYIVSSHCPEYIIEDTSRYFYLHYFYHFAIMLLGAYLAKEKYVKQTSKKDLIKLFISIGLYYAYKGILIKYGLIIPQLFLPLLLIMVMYYMYKAAKYFIQKNVIRNKSVQSVIFYISTLTLDIYIVQFVFIRYAKNYPFPLGLFGALVIITLSAILLNYISKHIAKFTYIKFNLKQ